MRRLTSRIQNIIPKRLLKVGGLAYNRLPLDIRYGNAFRQMSNLLDRSQFWSQEQHQDYQLKSIQSLVRHAYNNVPFYTELYNKAGLHPSDITSIEAFKKVPPITKESIRNDANRMKADNFPASKFQYHTTGGSTGIPIGFFWESDRTVPIERAFMRRQWRWAGFEMEKDRSVILRGLPLGNGRISEQTAGNQMRISTYDMTAENIEHYLNIIRDFQPIAIQAYPSAAHIIAQHILEYQHMEFPSLRAILCGSENIYSWQREIIQRAFGCRVYSWYGQSEYVSLAGECEHSTKYHFYSEYGFTEILREEGDAPNGMIGEIVATGFNNYAMPLIRYKTGDLARVSLRQECVCNRHYLLADGIEGRLQELIVGKHGNLISMTAINMHSTVFDHVYQFQFYQDTPGELRMSLVRKSTYTENDEVRIRKELSAKLRDHFELKIVYVDSILTTHRGKINFLVQKLST